MIIGLSGYGGAGKDTVAKYLVENYGYERRAFADPIKDALVKLNPYITPNVRVSDIVEAYGWDVAKKGYPEARRLLQVLGTEVGREMFGEDFWVILSMTDILPEDKIVFSDVRFESEAREILKLGGILVRVDRPTVGPVNSHESEVALDKWDFDWHLRNVDTKDTLHRMVDLFAREYGIHRLTPPVSA